MKFFYVIVIIMSMLYNLPLSGMESQGKQLELCSTRRTYINTARALTAVKKCPFCDEEILKKNYILSENQKKNVREICNLSPYLYFDQGDHLVIMPVKHVEHPDEVSSQDFKALVMSAYKLSKKLFNDAYSQEYFLNWTPMAGSSVPHFHFQLKKYERPPLSLPEQVEQQANPRIKTIDEKFQQLKEKLSVKQKVHPLSQLLANYKNENCLCCKLGKNDRINDRNFIVSQDWDLKYNFVCLSHFPRWAGELSVVPFRHVSTITHLSKEELTENMLLAKVLLPIMQQYAHENIRECTGGNLYTKSLGGQETLDAHKNYHVHTTVIPRTIIHPTPGTMDGNSCKLDYDPRHLFAHLKSMKEEIQKKLQ